MVMITCSLMVNGPGLSETPKILTLGTIRAQARMSGKEISCATICGGCTWLGWARARRRIKEGGTYAGNGDGRIAEEEELVEAGDDNGPDEADEPCAGGRTGHVGVVCVGDGGTHLGVRRVILCTRRSALEHEIVEGVVVLTEVLGVVCEVGVVKVRGRDDIWGRVRCGQRG